MAMRHLISRVVLLILVATFLAPFAYAASCPAISRSLAFGARGSDVRDLQLFLIDEGYLLSDMATGYFGLITEQAVRDMQRSAGIVSSGSATSTGWGAVGPKTRASLASLCRQSGSWATNGPPHVPQRPAATSSAPASTTPVCAPLADPITSCESAWTKVNDARGCAVSWQCRVSPATVLKPLVAPDQPPTIEGISGPGSLSSGQRASWSIQASDPEGKSLQYGFSWGDGGAFDRILQIAQVFTTLPSSAHTYVFPGFYTISGTVRDSAGNTAELSFGVSVVASAATSTSLFVGAPPVASSSVPFDTNYWNNILLRNTATGTPAALRASCTTPWGDKEIASGELAPMEPWFTGGDQSLGEHIPMMRCESGLWLTCDWNGSYCTSYGASTLPSASILRNECPAGTTWCSGSGGYAYCAVPPTTCN